MRAIVLTVGLLSCAALVACDGWVIVEQEPVNEVNGDPELDEAGYGFGDSDDPADGEMGDEPLGNP